LYAHNNLKTGAHYTKIRRPVALKYFETFKTLGESRSREVALKKLSRAEKVLLITGKECIISGMAKRASQDIKPRTSRSKKTKKRLDAKHTKLAAKKKKK
jgi:predicted GIY-YIG superfamily endonuclease